MLDAFKNMTGGKSKLVQKQTDELEAAHRHRPRGAQRDQRDADRAHHPQRQAGAAGQDARAGVEKTVGVSTRLDEIAKRLTAIDDHTRELAELDKRIQGLKESAKQAEQTTQKALGT